MTEAAAGSERQPNWAAGKIAVVTGGNRGIGREVCRQLGEAGACVILGSRDPAKGKAAAAEIRALGFDVNAQALNLDNVESIVRFATILKQTFGRVDILINNAGIFPGRESNRNTDALQADPRGLRSAFETNVVGPLLLCQVLAPLLKGGSRIVNVSSGMGQLADMGTGHPGYRLSKAALNALTRILAGELADRGVKVNSVCPGWVRTDMGGASAPRTPAEGARSVLWAAALPNDGPTGGFFRDGQPIPW